MGSWHLVHHQLVSFCAILWAIRLTCHYPGDPPIVCCFKEQTLHHASVNDFRTPSPQAPFLAFHFIEGVVCKMEDMFLPTDIDAMQPRSKGANVCVESTQSCGLVSSPCPGHSLRSPITKECAQKP
ncbi:hypothetical protein GOODEAATRI_027466 [Goodea atripinnis]|uniref:Secreted protein n=1 Tax=Goodea atripinnis TaxID=208336 RepID=A0ABV0PSL8_9TELE